MRNLSTRSLTLSYIVALGLVAGMSFASHWTLNSVLIEHEGAASVVNVSGRQRMLSQRIAGLAAQYTFGGSDSKGDLIAAVDQFESIHNKLLNGDDALKVPAATSRELAEIYFRGSPSLDETVRKYVADARMIAAVQPNDQRSKDALSRVFAAARTPLLMRLEQVVKSHQETSERQLKLLEQIQVGSLIVVLITLLAEALGVFRPMVRRMMSYTAELIRIAATDPLTGALNRRSFNERGTAELERAKRYDRATSILMLDIDRFKNINDTYGHGGGDAVLKVLVTCLQERLRPSDILGRLGGEEFAIILAETDITAAAAVAERLRLDIAALRVAVDEKSLSFSASIGVAQFAVHATNIKPALDDADRALYRAKSTGRNRVVVNFDRGDATAPEFAGPPACPDLVPADQTA